MVQEKKGNFFQNKGYAIHGAQDAEAALVLLREMTFDLLFVDLRMPGMGGIQLISVGILGEYIARIYDEVKERPKFIVDRAEGFGKNP